ncbi:putative Ig domain-containing protein [Protaetiibacter sp. SSC-01]|uniref:putative Ig domain-containing protein n=1 Tax=Protaetiibacter sp. SSC-01 TaxID=2759943 RepID=UPI0016571A65|nr:putative Ig domain-containing protein [Protaetiibacter sp. SSC-01]QNO36765.1 putative Ig domain-containing protein [Protaetiibacter sp. SSC-01]
MRRTRTTGGLAGLAALTLAMGGVLLLDAPAVAAEAPEPTPSAEASAPPDPGAADASAPPDTGVADADAPVFTTPPQLPSALRGVSYATWIAADADPPATFAVTSGALPAGLALSPDGLISGTPATVDDATFTVTATTGEEGSEATAERQFTLAVTPQVPVFATGELPTARAGTPYEAAIVAFGTPTASYALVGGALPPGLTLRANGTIDGTPAASGTVGFTVRATITDGGESTTATRDFTLVVAPRAAAPAPGRPPAAPPPAGTPGGEQEPAPAPEAPATPSPSQTSTAPDAPDTDGPTIPAGAGEPGESTGGDEDLTWLWLVAGVALVGAVAATVLLVRRIRSP